MSNLRAAEGEWYEMASWVALPATTRAAMTIVELGESFDLMRYDGMKKLQVLITCDADLEACAETANQSHFAHQYPPAGAALLRD